MKKNQAADNSTANYNAVERGIRILEALRENTDTEEDSHKISQAELRAEGENGDPKYGITGNNRTVRDSLVQLIRAVNPPVYEDNPEAYRIRYSGYEGDPLEKWEDACAKHPKKKPTMPTITGLQYVQDFSYAELDQLIAAVSQSPSLNETEREELIKKIRDKLGNKYYRQRKHSEKEAQGSLMVSFSKLDERTNENICIIREAIAKKKRVRFYFNEMDAKGVLTPRKRNGKNHVYTASPYHLVEYENKVYMISNTHSSKKGVRYDNASHYRVDLMSDIDILSEARRPISEINGLPDPWDSRKYMQEHLYMFFSDPRWISIRVKKYSIYAIRDRFGENFRNLIDNGDTYELSVLAPPDAFSHWVMTVSDYVEVLDPEVRKMVANNCKKMMEVYHG